MAEKRIKDWLNTAVSGIRFKPDRAAVEQELREHLDDKIEDLQLDITVTAEKSGAAYAYTVTYDRSAHYDKLYFTIDGQTARYNWEKNTTMFKNQNTSEEINLEGGATHTLTVHFDTSAAPTAVSYMRGVRAAQGGTP